MSSTTTVGTRTGHVEKMTNPAKTKTATHGGIAQPENSGLLDIIRREHEAVIGCTRDALAHSKAAGDGLIALKIAHSLRAATYRVLGMTERTAQRYKQIAKHWREIDESDAETVSEALAIICRSKREPGEGDDDGKAETVAAKMKRRIGSLRETAEKMIADVDTLNSRQRESVAREVAELRDTVAKLAEALTAKPARKAA